MMRRSAFCKQPYRRQRSARATGWIAYGGSANWHSGQKKISLLPAGWRNGLKRSGGIPGDMGGGRFMAAKDRRHQKRHRRKDSNPRRRDNNPRRRDSNPRRKGNNPRGRDNHPLRSENHPRSSENPPASSGCSNVHCGSPFANFLRPAHSSTRDFVITAARLYPSCLVWCAIF